MASSSFMIAGLLLLAAAGAAAQATGNMNFLPPLKQTPGLAKPGARLYHLCDLY
jgi:hypothetical protein